MGIGDWIVVGILFFVFVVMPMVVIAVSILIVSLISAIQYLIERVKSKKKEEE